MKRVAHAVIGANYGDEGKGLITDYLCSTGVADVVVRFNGGAQAGHTVVTPDGCRHVFHHIGSGAFFGIPTYLGPQFVCNPILFMQEYAELAAKLGSAPKVVVHPMCRITTPWDMARNQACEDERGSKRHGSVGVGIFETMTRCRDANYATHVSTFDQPRPYVETVLHAIAARARGKISHEFSVERFLDDCERFVSCIEVCDLSFLRNAQVLFEGAQGLALSEDNTKDFPYLTPSRTGLRGAAEIVEACKIERVEALYVTRSYLTRHGAGPLPEECLAPAPHDDTNIPHPYQGTLRWAPLSEKNEALMLDRIAADVRKVRTMTDVVWSLAVTHLDQIGGDMPGTPARLQSEGSTRTAVQNRAPVAA